MIGVFFSNLISTVLILERIFFVLLIIRMVAAFFPPRARGLWYGAVDWSQRLTEPLLIPIRQRVPPLGALDLSPLIALFLMNLAVWVLTHLLGLVARL